MKAHRMDQETVERLLVGPVVDPRDGREPLAALLTAVRAAPRPAELRGEHAAMQAFRLARAGAPLAVPVPVPVTARAGRPGVLGRVAGLKIAVAGLAVAATGGVALAAATGALPGPLHRPDVRPVAPSVGPTGGASATSHPSPAGTPSTMDPTRPRASAPSVGLCRAYRAGAGDNPGRTLDNPVFSDLIRDAGGREKVAGYCDQVTGEAASPTRPSAPESTRPPATATARPDARPSRASISSASTPARPTNPGPR
ncbi:hypothetical protein V6U81_21655 [Micromonospora sp. CPCC 205711]|uniref:hypothetical protein n=1 Tax=Micromonospora sp. CPCC 205547 TaxID=3122400 RepID=UPI002FF1FC3B